MRVLVTGGAGFIGGHVVDVLRSHGHQPAVVDDLSTGSRANVAGDTPFYECDIRDARSLEKVFDEFKPEAVSHQAAQMSVSRSIREPAYDASVNIVGLVNTLVLAAKHAVERFVFASSGGVLYGNVFEPAGENSAADPISPYGIGKWTGEKYAEYFSRLQSLKSVALRYANVFGPRQDPRGEAGVVAIFCTQMLAGEQTTIHGDGSIVRDFVYVEDVARANLLALESPIDRDFVAINIGTSQPTTINQLAEEIRRLAQTRRDQLNLTGEIPEPGHGPPRPCDLQSNLVDIRRAAELLGWSPTTSFADALEKTVAWFSQHRS